MPKRIAAALLLMILKNVVSIKRRLREAVHLRLLLGKERAEKEKAEKVLNHQNLMPVLRRRALEALAPRENQSRYAVRNGKPVVLANGEINANFGIPSVQILCQRELQGG